MIFENDDIVALLDTDPISLVPSSICPKTHFTDFHELPISSPREDDTGKRYSFGNKLFSIRVFDDTTEGNLTI